MLDALFQQQPLIRAVAVEDRRLREKLAQLLTPLCVRLDDLYVHAGSQQLPCQIITHPAAADEHGVADLFLRDAEALHEVGKHRNRRGDVDVVAAAQHGIAGRNECVAVTDDGADEHLAAQHMRQVV